MSIQDVLKSLMFSFIKEVQGELKAVSWPTRDEVVRLTSIVIAISLIVGVYIGTLDLGFTKLLETIVK